ncbi:MAG TPA: tetratricopeptide repeat protein [Pyrinomonadaceae bacterium]|jgi:Flp pilus assembly protein TadD
MWRIFLSLQSLVLTIICLVFSANALAQSPPSSIQLFMPNGGMPSHPIQLTLVRSDGYTDTVFTDSKGTLQMRTPTIQGVNYTATINGDRQTYDTTTITFSLYRNTPARITVFLKPLPAEKRPAKADAVLDVANFEGNVPAKARTPYKRAMELVSADQLERAIPAFQEAISRYPKYVRAMNDLGVTFMKLRHLDEAADSFRKAIDIDKRFFHPRMNLGIVLNKQGKYKEALEILEPLYSENRGTLEVRLAYGQALGGAGEFAEAEKLYRSTLESKNLGTATQAILHFRLGVLLNREGRFTEAVSELEKAIAIDPDAANFHLQLGAALMQLQDADKAERELLRAYELAGNQVGTAQLLLGHIYYAEKKFGAAQRSFEQYLKDVPSAVNREQITSLIADLKAASKN